LGENDQEKIKTFNRWYPWPKSLKKTKTFTFRNLGQK